MIKKIVFCLLIVILISCGKGTKKPADVLEQDQMVKVLSEVYIAEQKVANLAFGVDSSQRLFGAMRNLVFEKTGVPDSVFKRSMDYYMEHPKELEQIYAVLVDSLQLREQRTMP